MNIDESKQELRAHMQEQLRTLDAEDRRGRSLKICNRVLELPVWKRARVVVVFEPFPYEPEIAPLSADLRRRGSEIIVILPTARAQGRGSDGAPAFSIAFLLIAPRVPLKSGSLLVFRSSNRFRSTGTTLSS